MATLNQLYDKAGVALNGQGATSEDLFSKGLLHGAAHVWLWREREGRAEVLLQRRAAKKPTWPNRFDISAAGHIDLGEDPLTAGLRETKEELGLDLASDKLCLIGVHRAYLLAENNVIENEFQWLYLAELPGSEGFTLQDSEVASLEWQTLEKFKQESATERYVPHGDLYYTTVVRAVERALSEKH